MKGSSLGLHRTMSIGGSREYPQGELAKLVWRTRYSVAEDFM